ncbi:MAG: hypothetical protein ACD_62C00046G0001 [uncultured bacterium]|nr:MAG: hypothetical protein ACD_62C00046G0001 [uncultured bacterium]
MRLGTNHGSLSGRIMSRFGDTPEGMVESALDFVRIAHKHNYHDIILSMKASNVRVMVQAYRLLVVKLDELQLPLPFHLGVTEAGDAEEGRIKSSAGIGTLLEDGIGDTIRVSLTEDPVNEIAVAHLIATPYNQRFYSASFSTAQTSVQQTPPFSASSFKRRTSSAHIIGLLPTGGPHNVSVWTRIDSLKQYAQALQPDPFGLAFEGIEMESGHSPAFPSDFKKELRLPISLIANEVPPLMEARFASKLALLISSNRLPLLVRELMEHAGTQNTFVEFCFSKSALDEASLSNLIGGIKKLADSLRFEQFGFSLQSTRPNRDYRLLTMALSALDLSSPVHLRWCQTDLPPITDASAQLGALLIDGIGDSLQIDSEQSLSENLNFCYSLLQACRVRISKTEYISCPSCGRTQFDLQAVLAKIKARTAHLKGLKLGVMGCIVNGPGEMADADFGYVGMGTGKVCLYVGQTCVERNIPEDCALDKLIALIKQEGKWGKDY